jgi:hypothetical protein
MIMANALNNKFSTNGVHLPDRRPTEGSASDMAEKSPVGEPLGLGNDQVLKVPNKDSPALPWIQAEPDETIRVGAGGPLVVPREDLDADIDDSAEIDLLGGQLKIRRPNRWEWIVLLPRSELTTRLLLDKPEADGITTDYYYVEQHLRSAICNEMKAVRVFLYYSCRTKNFGLWVVKITPGNSWYESLDQLFEQPEDFFTNNAIRVASDKTMSRYRVRSRPHKSVVDWPKQSTGTLLGEALGADHWIRSAEHPLYRGLIDGTEVI